MDYTRTIIMSLGGSLLFPEEIDIAFIKQFKELIEKHIALGTRFIVITGGGKICRKYQNATKELRKDVTHEDLDWVGIYTTRMNGRFMQYVLGDLASEQLVTDPHTYVDDGKPVVIGAGWKPGWSTDYDAVEIAQTVGAQTLINLSNITHVYSADPKVDPDAHKREALTWDEYRALIPSEWTPGLNTPFDPHAAKRAQGLGLTVTIMGPDLTNVDTYLREGVADGTIIS